MQLSCLDAYSFGNVIQRVPELVSNVGLYQHTSTNWRQHILFLKLKKKNEYMKNKRNQKIIFYPTQYGMSE
jgi:hypothetical protein